MGGATKPDVTVACTIHCSTKLARNAPFVAYYIIENYNCEWSGDEAVYATC
jgi:hypothetical protein